MLLFTLLVYCWVTDRMEPHETVTIQLSAKVSRAQHVCRIKQQQSCIRGLIGMDLLRSYVNLLARDMYEHAAAPNMTPVIHITI